MIGIVGYGFHVPIWRIKASEIASVWGADKERVKKLVGEKAVAGMDEDTATISVEASRNALRMSGIDPGKIGAVYIGSESHPYIVKSTSSIVAEAIGATPFMTAADLEFACKAGTAGIQMAMGLAASGKIEYGLAIGADTAQGRPGDELEYTAASGGAAYLIGAKNVIAEIEDTFSFTTDTPDFWRREGEDFPRHGGRFTGAPGYFRHVISATKGMLERMKRTVEDYDHFVFHQPNYKFPMTVAKTLGIPKEKMEKGLLVHVIGNTYSGASLLGLAAVLDEAKPGEKILVTSFGSGAGSDSFSIVVREEIEKRRIPLKIRDMIGKKRYLNYSEYAKFRKKLKGVEE